MNQELSTPTLIASYKHLVNIQLPAAYRFPVQHNHCFNRIILDWLFSDCWYNKLDRNKTAISQLTAQQIALAVNRMKEWLLHPGLLIADNNQSLQYRKRWKENSNV